MKRRLGMFIRSIADEAEHDAMVLVEPRTFKDLHVTRTTFHMMSGALLLDMVRKVEARSAELTAILDGTPFDPVDLRRLHRNAMTQAIDRYTSNNTFENVGQITARSETMRGHNARMRQLLHLFDALKRIMVDIFEQHYLQKMI